MHPDGVHPRHLGWLPNKALTVLAWLLRFVDALGNFPKVQRNVFIAMYNKPTGGLRTIGYFRALYRVWAKCLGMSFQL